MYKKKNCIVNCDVCDTRKMKEEEYSHYEQIVINADIVIVSESSKSLLNKLPVTLNHDKIIELTDMVEVAVKTVSGSYIITEETTDAENTVLVVDGNLLIESGTEEIMKKYVEIVVNGSLKYPKSLGGFLDRMTINGSAKSYPDECKMMDSELVIDKYFPLRAKEGSKYYVENVVIIKDKEVDVEKLAGKNIEFITPKAILPENKIEESLIMFDERVEIVAVPDGMELIYGDTLLNETLVANEGGNLFIYGNVELDANADMNRLGNRIDKLDIMGSVTVRKEQETAFKNWNTKYKDLIISKNSVQLKNMPKVKIDKSIFENASEGIEVSNVVKVAIEKDVTAEMILDKLTVMNCALITCSAEQASAVQAVSINVGKIGRPFGVEEGMDDIGGVMKCLSDTKMVNADSYVM